MPLRLDGVVARCPPGGVVAAHQDVRATPTMPSEIERQPTADDHFDSLRDGRLGARHEIGGAGLDAAQIQHRAVELGEEFRTDGVGEGATTGEDLQQRLILDGAGSEGAGRVELVVGLDRAAAGGIRVEGEVLPLWRVLRRRKIRRHQAQPRWRATIPPVRLRHSTPRQPERAIIAASLSWLGQARIDSAR